MVDTAILWLVLALLSLGVYFTDGKLVTQLWQAINNYLLR